VAAKVAVGDADVLPNRAETKVASARELLTAATGGAPEWCWIWWLQGRRNRSGAREGETAMLSAQADVPRAERRLQNDGCGAFSAHQKAMIES
jgi:hypothetical protein